MNTAPTVRHAIAYAVAACLVPAAAPVFAGYNSPPDNIRQVMRAPALPAPMMSPTGDRMLMVSMQEYPSITRVAEPFLKLAGARVEPRNHSKHDTPGGYGINPCVANLDLVNVADGKQQHIGLPAGACPGTPIWSADGKRFVFSNVAKESVELWVGEAGSAKVRKIAGLKLNPMFNEEVQWMPDQQHLLVKLVPAGIGNAPTAPASELSPNIQESTGKAGQSSTYETRDTLKSPHDEALFDYYAASQLALVNASSGKVTLIGKPANYDSLEPAPDGKHILVDRIHQPYSYVVAYNRFPVDIEVWDVSNPAKVAIKTIASVPLTDSVPVRGVRKGPRSHVWRPLQPATLVWAEALDEGNWKVNVPARDKVMMQSAPFTAAPVEIARTTQRFAGISWTERADTAMLYEYDANRNWMRTAIFNADKPEQAHRVWVDMSTEDRYNNPGSPVMRRLPNGEAVIRMDGNRIFLTGSGSSPDGDRPFLDRLDLETLTSERLFRSGKDAYERVISLQSGDGSRFLTLRQTPVDPPNVWARSLGTTQSADKGEAKFALAGQSLTHVEEVTPVIRQIKKQLVKYKREDGVDLSFTLYTPPGYKEGTRLPAILNAYPLDYADASKAGQVSGSQQTYTRLRQYKLLLLSGYAIIDSASFPIVGDPRTAYDTYLPQLIANAKAAVNEAVKMGVVDPERIGVTGHSHGALMTANLLAHTNLFKAGVATSGSYNKTLTPFGFQNERRSVWEAPEVYKQASTFFFADKLKTPILIMHGEDDANPGTTPLQATKLYEAIRGNGGITRLVMLPHEPHWYTALESNEQEVYEMVNWFDKYVKNASANVSEGK
ncbi:prolyl oligopeptidase family serine peptidase [Burkholderiaceae bacterium DAT-1]|nr:prolyl oligopeptidase family serine peptidase [Burkholderiaceae bacterium DAT-1]